MSDQHSLWLNERLGLWLGILRRQMNEEPPNPQLLLTARCMMNLYPRSDLPDWVECLANGDESNLAAVVEIAKADILASEAVGK